MIIATNANVQMMQAAASKGLTTALRIAFVVGLGLSRVSLTFYLVALGFDNAPDLSNKLLYDSDSLAGFGFGASSIALFAHVASGIEYPRRPFRILHKYYGLTWPPSGRLYLNASDLTKFPTLSIFRLDTLMLQSHWLKATLLSAFFPFGSLEPVLWPPLLDSSPSACRTMLCRENLC